MTSIDESFSVERELELGDKKSSIESSSDI